MRKSVFNRKESTDNEKYACEESISYTKANSKKKKLFLILGTLIVLIIAITIIFMNIGTTSLKVDPFKYTKVSFEGYSSNGTAMVTFDEYSLICDIIGEEPDSLGGGIEWSNNYDRYSEGISYSLEPSEKLSNGNVVTVSFKITGTAKNVIRSHSKEFTVEGLTEVETVDVFKDITLTFKGVSGKATATIEYASDSEFLKDCSIKFSDMENLCNGDKVTLTITNVDSLIETYHKVPKELSKEYEISGLGTYVTKAEQLPIDVIKEFAERFMKEEQESNDNDDDSMFSYSAVKYYGSHFMFPKEGIMFVPNNKLHIVVSYDVFYRDEYLRTNYSYCEFKNIICNPDGTVDLRYEDISDGWTTDIDAHFEDEEEDYIVEIIEGLNVGDIPENVIETEKCTPATEASETEIAQPETTPIVIPEVTTRHTPETEAPVITVAPSDTSSTPIYVVKQRADPETGISWDGVSPIIYTYPDGTTGTEIRIGATYEVVPGMINTVDKSYMPNWEPATNDNICDHCGKTMGDGTSGTCLRYWTGGDHTCSHCGVVVPQSTCHTCND